MAVTLHSRQDQGMGVRQQDAERARHQEAIPRDQARNSSLSIARAMR